jgi:Zn-dependent alcohol dehydrogenase
MQIFAAVARERFGDFSIEPLELAEPRAGELLVEIVASGMCQTDLHGRDGYTTRRCRRCSGTRARASSRRSERA